MVPVIGTLELNYFFIRCLLGLIRTKMIIWGTNSKLNNFRIPDFGALTVVRMVAMRGGSICCPASVQIVLSPKSVLAERWRTHGAPLVNAINDSCVTKLKHEC